MPLVLLSVDLIRAWPSCGLKPLFNSWKHKLNDCINVDILDYVYIVTFSNGRCSHMRYKCFVKNL